eukprot:4085671-Pyramimonas_sp.AAC.2
MFRDLWGVSSRVLTRGAAASLAWPIMGTGTGKDEPRKEGGVDRFCPTAFWGRHAWPIAAPRARSSSNVRLLCVLRVKTCQVKMDTFRFGDIPESSLQN